MATVLVAIAACQPIGAASAPPPSEADARAYLDSVVALVQSGDLEAVCALGSGTCDAELRNADLARRPDEPPTLVGMEIVETVDHGGGASDLGGRLLQLCGVDGSGDPYYSEMLVFRDASGKLISINTLFWLGSRVARSPVVGASTPPSPC